MYLLVDYSVEKHCGDKKNKNIKIRNKNHKKLKFANSFINKLWDIKNM
jgi:hypothetical protein